MRSSSFGGSGDGPTPEQMETWRRRFGAPENELPGSTAIGLVLGRTEDIAVGITAVEAHTAGFSFTLAVRLRSERAGGLGHRLYELIAGHHHPQDQPPAAEERLLLGVEYADGRIATNVTPVAWPGDPRARDLGEDEVVLATAGGGGGGRRFDQAYWVTPLPPPGPLAFVCAWQALGVAESRSTVDAGLILEAATRAQVLWPWQPDEPATRPADPPAPSSGWFADAVRGRTDPPER